MGIVILETDNIYQTSVIEHIRAITDTVGKIEGISSVSSITNIINENFQEIAGFTTRGRNFNVGVRVRL